MSYEEKEYIKQPQIDVDSEEFENYVWTYFPWMRVDNDENSPISTYWYDIPIGWRRAFGIQWLEDINRFYKTLPPEEQNEFYPIQIKEKWGELRCYWSICYEELDNILDKYAELSRTHCICCGALAEGYTTGWIMPICEECAIKYKYKFEKKEN